MEHDRSLLVCVGGRREETQSLRRLRKYACCNTGRICARRYDFAIFICFIGVCNGNVDPATATFWKKTIAARRAAPVRHCHVISSGRKMSRCVGSSLIPCGLPVVVVEVHPATPHTMHACTVRARSRVCVRVRASAKCPNMTYLRNAVLFALRRVGDVLAMLRVRLRLGFGRTRICGRMRARCRRRVLRLRWLLLLLLLVNVHNFFYFRIVIGAGSLCYILHVCPIIRTSEPIAHRSPGADKRDRFCDSLPITMEHSMHIRLRD